MLAKRCSDSVDSDELNFTVMRSPNRVPRRGFLDWYRLKVVEKTAYLEGEEDQAKDFIGGADRILTQMRAFLSSIRQ